MPALLEYHCTWSRAVRMQSRDLVLALRYIPLMSLHQNAARAVRSTRARLVIGVPHLPSTCLSSLYRQPCSASNQLPGDSVQRCTVHAARMLHVAARITTPAETFIHLTVDAFTALQRTAASSRTGEEHSWPASSA